MALRFFDGKFPPSGNSSNARMRGVHRSRLMNAKGPTVPERTDRISRESKCALVQIGVHRKWTRKMNNDNEEEHLARLTTGECAASVGGVGTGEIAWDHFSPTSRQHSSSHSLPAGAPDGPAPCFVHFAKERKRFRLTPMPLETDGTRRVGSRLRVAARLRNIRRTCCPPIERFTPARSYGACMGSWLSHDAPEAS